MSQADDDHSAQMARFVADGYQINPTAFERIRFWNFVLFQLHFAVAELERLIADTPEKYDITNTYDQHARFVAIIVTYGRCFAQTGERIKSLDANEIFKGEPRFKGTHERMMDIRNKVVAHTDHHDLMRATLAVKEGSAEITIRHFVQPVFPKSEYQGYHAAMSHVIAGVRISINKQLDRLQKDLGKTISLGEI